MSDSKEKKRIKPKALLREAKRRFKKNGKRLDEESRHVLQASIAGLEKAIKAGGPEGIEEAKHGLYETITKYTPRTGLNILGEYVRAFLTAVLIALFVRQFVIEPFRIPTGSMIPTLSIGDKILVTKFTYGLNIPFTNIKIFAFNKPKRWDVVVFTTRNIKDSSTIEKNFVKRVVGLPGETIEIRDGEIIKSIISTNGEEIEVQLQKPDALRENGLEYGDYTNFSGDKVSTIKLYDLRRWMGIYPFYAPNGDNKVVHWKYGRVGQKIKVPPGHYFVLGDNSRNSFDSRGWGFVPFDNIRGKVICKWKFLPPWGDGIVR